MQKPFKCPIEKECPTAFRQGCTGSFQCRRLNEKVDKAVIDKLKHRD